jgi:hypothetical protein
MLSSTCVSWASTVTPPPDAPSWWNSETGDYAYAWWSTDIVSSGGEVQPGSDSSHWASNYLDRDEFEADIATQTVTIELGNEYRPDLYKQIYIYITGTTLSTTNDLTSTLDTGVGIFNPGSISTSVTGGTWTCVVSGSPGFGVITPQPEMVTLHLTVPGMTGVTNIWAGERCIPEPATICMLGLGALSLIRRKKLA